MKIFQWRSPVLHQSRESSSRRVANLVIYAVAGGVSIAALYMGGYLSGIMLGLCLAVYCFIVSKKRKYPVAEPFKWSNFVRALWKSLPAIGCMIVVVGGVLFGWMTATESAAAACVLLHLHLRDRTCRNEKGSLRSFFKHDQDHRFGPDSRSLCNRVQLGHHVLENSADRNRRSVFNNGKQDLDAPHHQRNLVDHGGVHEYGFHHLYHGSDFTAGNYQARHAPGSIRHHVDSEPRCRTAYPAGRAGSVRWLLGGKHKHGAIDESLAAPACIHDGCAGAHHVLAAPYDVAAESCRVYRLIDLLLGGFTMRYGMCTDIATATRDRVEYELLKRIKEAGFDFVEFPLMMIETLSDDDFEVLLADSASWSRL